MYQQTLKGTYNSNIPLLFFLDPKNGTFTEFLSYKNKTIEAFTQTEEEYFQESKPHSKPSLIRPVLISNAFKKNENINEESKTMESTDYNLSEFFNGSKNLNLLGKKRLLKVEIKKEEEKKENKENLFETTRNEKNSTKKCLKKLGRKKKIEKEENKTIYLNTHSKFAEDNIMKKIKSFLFESIRLWLNSAFPKEITNADTSTSETFSDSFEQGKNSETKTFSSLIFSKNKTNEEVFCKLNFKGIINNITRDFNLKMLSRTISDIYSSEINNKYKKKDKNCNAETIRKIMESKDEKLKNLKSILNLTLTEVLLIFNGKLDENTEIKNKVNEETLNQFQKVESFLKKIEKQEEDNKEMSNILIEIYKNSVKDLCLNYTDWFQKRTVKKQK